MSSRKTNLYIGGVIILIGILSLLANTNVLYGVDDLLGGLFLLIVAFVFFNIYNGDRSKWWPLLPATILAFLGVGVLLQTFLPIDSDILGAAFMFAVFAVFGYVYTREPSQWWAVIPAGAAFTIGVVVLIDEFNMLDSSMSGVVFFLGLGLTFFYLWSLRQENRNLSWAIWPAVVLAILAVVAYIDATDWLDPATIFPLLLILVGVLIIVHGMKKKIK